MGHNFRTAAAPSSTDINAAADDAIRAEAALAFVRHVNTLANQKTSLAAVRASVKAFVGLAQQSLETGQTCEGLTPVARAHWALVKEELLKPPEPSAAPAGLPFFAIFGKEDEDDRELDQELAEQFAYRERRCRPLPPAPQSVAR